MTQESQLLRIDEITPEALTLWLTLLQASNPRGQVLLSDSDIVTEWNRLITGRRFSRDKLVTYRDELLDVGLIPSKEEVYPFGALPADVSQEQAERIAQAAIENHRSGAPDESKRDHSRLAAVLYGLDMAIVFQEIKREPVRDANGKPLFVEGKRKYYERPKWDYGYASMMIKRHGLDALIQTAFSIYEGGYLQRMEWSTLKEKKERFTAYFASVLSGDADDVESDDDFETGW